MGAYKANPFCCGNLPSLRKVNMAGM